MGAKAANAVRLSSTPTSCAWLADNEAYFSGLTFRRQGDRLLIYIVLSQEGTKTEHELSFERVPI